MRSGADGRAVDAGAAAVSAGQDRHALAGVLREALDLVRRLGAHRRGPRRDVMAQLRGLRRDLVQKVRNLLRQLGALALRAPGDLVAPPDGALLQLAAALVSPLAQLSRTLVRVLLQGGAALV